MKEKKNKAYRNSVVLRLLGYAKPYTLKIIFSVVLVFILTLLDLYRPTLVGKAIDSFSTIKDYSFIQETAIKYGFVLCLQAIFGYLEMTTLQVTGQKIITDLRKEIYEHVESLNSRYFDITPVGTIVTRVTNDVEALNQMYSGALVRMFRNGLSVIGYVVAMFLLDVKMAIASIILVPLVTICIGFFEKTARKIYREVRTRITAINTFLSENISGMKIIQIFGRETRKFEEFNELNKKLFNSSKKEMMVFAIFRPLINILGNLSIVIVLYVGSRLVFKEQLSIGTLYIFSQYIQWFFEPIEEIAEQISSLQSSFASAEKIFTILDNDSKIVEKENPIILEKIKGKIEFDHVYFAYDDENYILKDVSFKIEEGENVAFVGATGAGKTSILNLIGRYYDIQKGHIYIDDVDIKDLSIKQLRSAIGQMQQDVFIFEGDIKKNIELYDDIDIKDIEKAAKMVNADNFIEKLPDKYLQKVTERGTTLSAGERQLLSFARTLAHDPKILVMDEATANIDTETEILIKEALEKMMKDRTTIMVAHRLSTIQNADKIIVMHKGRIKEEGKHQELLALNGIYKKLYDLQIREEN